MIRLTSICNDAFDKTMDVVQLAFIRLAQLAYTPFCGGHQFTPAKDLLKEWKLSRAGRKHGKAARIKAP
jgi:hypothetical protein